MIDLNFLKNKHDWKWKISIAAIIFFLILIIAFNYDSPLDSEKIKKEYINLLAHYQKSPILFTAGLFLIYVVSILFVIPDSIILSIITGTIYPLPVATIFISLSETVGAVGYFLIIRFACHQYFTRKNYQIVKGKAVKNFSNNQSWYLLFLRICHVIPFWLISLLSAVLRARTWTFIWTTFVGTLPLSLILAQTGKGLKKALESQEQFALRKVFDGPTELALIALAVVCLLPVVIKKYMKKF